MNAVEQIHISIKKMVFECLCHGFEVSFSEMDECMELPALVIFVSVDPLSALRKLDQTL